MANEKSEQGIRRGTPAVSDGGTSLSTRVYRALSHQRRRYVLYYLRDHDSAHTNDLAIYIAAQEQSIPENRVSNEAAKQVEITLVHNHLPKLAEYGLIDYDQIINTASYTYPPGLLNDVLDIAAQIENHL